jgi:hypothetical protein
MPSDQSQTIPDYVVCGPDYFAGMRKGHMEGLQRARDLAANGLHVEPDTTFEDFLIAIDAILAEERARNA